MSVREDKGKLILDFYCTLPDGRKIRCRESMNLPATASNRKMIERLHMVIEYEKKQGTFDYLKHFPHGVKAAFFKKARKQSRLEIILADWWLQWLSEKILRPNTFKNWNSAFRIHIEPALGHLLLTKIDEPTLLIFRKSLEKKLRPNSINDKIIKPLCMCLLKAYKRGLINHYPCTEIRRLTEDPTDIDPFSFDELTYLLHFLKIKQPFWYDFYLFWSRTGLRPGEICAIQWSHIDYFNCKLRIRKTRYDGMDGPPKTKYSIRDIDLCETAIKALKRQEARTKLKSEYIFLNRLDKPFSTEYLRKSFKHLLMLAGLRLRPPGHMRHTFATLSLGAGENISWVSRMLGHSSAHITWKRYNRYIPNLTRADGSALEKALSKQNGQILVKGKSNILKS